MRIFLAAAVALLVGFLLGRPAPEAPQRPRVWDAEEQRRAVALCMSDTINTLGYKGCNGETFCRCAVARAAKEGPDPDAWDAQRFEIAAKAYHNAVGHPCTEEAVKACNGWSD